MFDRRLVEHFDWGLLGLTLLLSGIGITILYSAVTAGEANPQHVFCVKQGVYLGAGLFIALFSTLFHYKLLEQWGVGIYLAAVVLLICVLLFGTYVGGARRWLVLGPLRLQPSEPVKIAVIIIMARYYARYATLGGLNFRDLVRPALLVLLPFGLIAKQPDLGTGMLSVLIAASMTMFVKIKRRTFICLASAATLAAPLVWFLLKGYQKQRILTFLNPDRDPLGAGYHIIQSKIAIGSGMLTGKGFLKGTQNALSFLPEQHTDFILSVLAEEWGFVGAAFLLAVYLIFIVWGLNIAYNCRDPFGTLLAFGVTAMIFWQMFINMGMVMGLMPVVGMPLPLISYGGSSVLTTMLGVGILLNVSMRRFMVE